MIRRGFLTGILALGAAPAIVRADSLMRVVPMDLGILPADDLYPRASDIARLNLRMADEIGRLLMQTNEILADLPWVEGDARKTVVRTGLPRRALRRLYVSDYTVEKW